MPGSLPYQPRSLENPCQRIAMNPSPERFFESCQQLRCRQRLLRRPHLQLLNLLRRQLRRRTATRRVRQPCHAFLQPTIAPLVHRLQRQLLPPGYLLGGHAVAKHQNRPGPVSCSPITAASRQNLKLATFFLRQFQRFQYGHRLCRGSCSARQYRDTSHEALMQYDSRGEAGISPEKVALTLTLPYSIWIP